MISVADILQALSLPMGARVDQRVPKKLLLEHGAPTAADKRKIEGGIEELRWLAALKPANCAVAAYRDAIREYLEIAVLSVTLRQETGEERLLALIHRAVPYPLLLIAVQGETVSLSLAHKRFSQGEAAKTVLDGEVLRINMVAGDPMNTAFLSAMDNSGQPANNLFVLYQGWIDRLETLVASRITGRFVLPATAQQAGDRRLALEAHARLAREISGLRTQAGKEKQINRQVALNMEIKRLEQQLGRIANTL